jgi:opacity protein-like surface antigen
MKSFLVAAALAAAITTPATAADYSFVLGGFSGGGTLSGSFSGNDDDGNGVISSFDPGTEVTAFAMTFSGDANIGDFSAGLSELLSLVYRPAGGTFLGDDALPYGEGLWVEQGSKNLIAGLGAYGEAGALVTDLDFDASSYARLPVTAVPEPAAWALWLIGVAGLAGARLVRRQDSLA